MFDAGVVFFFLCPKCQGGWGNLCRACEEEELEREQDE
jgi:hypothetical protein